MAKRFTDTEKWKKKWYRELGSKLRDVRQFVLDDCDLAGIWEIDLNRISYYVGSPVSLDEVRHAFCGYVSLLGDLDSLFIPAFLEFQYGNLVETNNAHRAVIRRLKLKNINQPLRSPSRGVQDKDKDKVQDKDQDQDKEKDKDKQPKFDFEALYQKYPRKEGKSPGLKQCAEQIRTQEKYDLLSTAIDRYAAHCADTKQILMHFGTFMGSKRTTHPWVDWCDPETGAGAIPTPIQDAKLIAEKKRKAEVEAQLEAEREEQERVMAEVDRRING